MKITKQYVTKNIRLSKNATIGSTIGSCIIIPREILEDENLSDRLYSNLEKWGWIEDRGRYVLTKEAFFQIPYIK